MFSFLKLDEINFCSYHIGSLIVLFNIFFLTDPADAQSHNYWTRSFNEESSLLSGAVVGGGSGPSAIYYNPAYISEVVSSKLSVNASLFSFDFLTLKNALGDGINLASTRGTVEPRFVSYMFKPKKHQNLSFELAFLNNENLRMDLTESVDRRIDILSQSPGVERYFGVYRYSHHFRDDWICLGSSLQLNDHLSFGISLNVMVKSLIYNESIDLEAYPTGEPVNPSYDPESLAAFQDYKYLKFNDYRLSGKFGIAYKRDRLSLGLTLHTPSLGGIYSDGKRVSRKEAQINITDPATGEPVPSFTIIDFKQKQEMNVSLKTPFSLAVGFTYSLRDGRRKLYLSAEYFAGREPFRMVEAEESSDIASGAGFDELIYTEWLTFVSGARPVFNVGIGYSWTLREDLRLMTGFRTDFNYQKNYEFGEYEDYSRIESPNLDLYYLTCGLSWRILGQDIITGVQYTVGRSDGQQQIANLADPVEYSPVEHLPLQGDPQYNGISVLNAISLYFGASFNFGEK